MVIRRGAAVFSAFLIRAVEVLIASIPRLYCCLDKRRTQRVGITPLRYIERPILTMKACGTWHHLRLVMF